MAEQGGSEDRGDLLGFGTVIVRMAIFVVIGTPMMYFLWGVLNELLTGQVDGRRVVLAIPVAAVFIVLLGFVARTVRRWDYVGPSR